MRRVLPLVVLFSGFALAQQQPPPGMAAYQVVFLNRGTPGASKDLIQAHLAHQERLEEEGVLVGAGPIAGDHPIRGLLILKGVDTARAREIASRAPAVKAGTFVVKVLPWWGPDNIGAGYFATMAANPAARPKMITYQLGLLRSGARRDQPRDEAEKIQKAHLAHIDAMARTGKLVAAGPFLVEDDLRGVFLFATTAEEARALAAKDPAVQAGRLVLDFYPWMVAEGVFAPKVP